MKKIKNYYSTQQFASLANVSTKTLGRLKKALLNINPETSDVIMKWNKNYYHFTILKQFVSEEVYKRLEDRFVTPNRGPLN